MECVLYLFILSNDLILQVKCKCLSLLSSIDVTKLLLIWIKQHFIFIQMSFLPPDSNSCLELYIYAPSSARYTICTTVSKETRT